MARILLCPHVALCTPPGPHHFTRLHPRVPSHPRESRPATSRLRVSLFFPTRPRVNQRYLRPLHVFLSFHPRPFKPLQSKWCPRTFPRCLRTLLVFPLLHPCLRVLPCKPLQFPWCPRAYPRYLRTLRVLQIFHPCLRVLPCEPLQFLWCPRASPRYLRTPRVFLISHRCLRVLLWFRLCLPQRCRPRIHALARVLKPMVQFSCLITQFQDTFHLLFSQWVKASLQLLLPQ